jgi:nitronate monooxygenase
VFVDRLGLEHPIMQAGMGGGIAGAELAGAVSSAGALGTVGILPPQALQAALWRARERSDGAPVAANLLIPFATRAHAKACLDGQADAVVLHGGFKRQLVDQLREGGTFVLHTVGTAEQARRALFEGAEGLIVQGREAGGHLVGVEPALDALARVLEVAGGAPVLLAGGIADAQDVRRALDAGAAAVVAGTRFLLSDECSAHAEYKRRVLEADRTLETLLFGLGWPMRHRVVPNAATDRWCRADARGPSTVRAAERLSGPLARLPMSVAVSLHRRQHPAIPLFGPASPLQGMAARLVDASALYAGETALRIESVIPAERAVAQLAGVAAGEPPESPTIRSS